jgi:hypothetical protein
VTVDDEAEPVIEDPTSASHTALPASLMPPARRRPVRRRKPGGSTPGRGSTPGGGSTPPPAWETPRGRRPGRRRTILIVAGAACAAAALVAGGAVLGTSLYPDRGPGAAPTGPPPTPVTTGTSGTPKLSMGQPFGGGVTVFVVHGSGFMPGTQVRVSLTGHGTSPVAETVDPKGTFNYAIDQGHQFFPGTIPVGDYQVVAAGAGGRTATARFTVLQPPGPPPPRGSGPDGGPPPAGNGAPPP